MDTPNSFNRKMVLLLALFFCLNLSARESFTIATQNLWHYTNDYDQRKKNLIYQLDIETPDIISFQEAWKYINGKSLFNVFLKKSNYKAHFFKTNNLAVMREGIATTTHFPLSGFKKFLLPYSKKFSKRPLLVSSIETPSGVVKVINVHFSPYREKLYQRQAQLNFLIDLIRKKFIYDNVIILGDFNQRDEGGFFSELQSLGFEKALNDGQCTFCSSNPYVDGHFSGKIDYIYYRPEHLTLVRSKRYAVSHPVSDHYGVLAEFQ